MFHKKKWAKLTAAGLVFSLAATMAVGPAADVDALEPPAPYKWEDTYTYAYEGSVVAYKDGEKHKDAEITKYETEDSDPFTPENEQAWDTKELVLKQGVSYTTNTKDEGVKVHPITSMLTNWNLCADPTAIDNSDVDGKLYVYGTTEAVEYDKSGIIKKNGYNNHSLTIMSTKDMVNWTDEGFIDQTNLTNEPEDSEDKVKCGWAQKSWAPSGLKIDGDGDGEDEYYLFYTNSGAVGYVQGDSPTGPWKDDLGKVLFSQSTPNCKGVKWCFDPAVLVDDKGDAYVYFGGGVWNENNEPETHPDGIAHPKTGRVCKIKFEEGTGKVLLDGDPQELDTFYLFEDSEINQFNGKYFYSYCTNFSVPAELNKPGAILGALAPIGSGQIACYVSKDPMNITFNPEEQESTDDLKYLGSILNNPSTIYGKSYNNHHHMLSFKGKEYMTYHSTALENMLYHTTQDYRCLHVAPMTVDKETDEIKIEPNYEGVEQVEDFNPYETINATTTSYSAGVKSAKSDAVRAMVLDKINTGDWTKISGVNFGDNGAAKVSAQIASNTDYGAVEVFVDDPTSMSNKLASLDLRITGDENYETFETNIVGNLTGKHDLYFVFRGNGYKVASWQFTEKEAAPATSAPQTPATTAPQTPATPAPVPPATVTPAPKNDEKVTVSKPAIKSVKNVKGKKADVTLKKKVSGADGYEIRYSLKKNMKSAKKVTIKKAKTLKVTLKKLKKKTYYVQARAYKTVDGKKYYSGWSGKKSVKIKK